MGRHSEDENKAFIRFLIHWVKGTDSEGEFWRGRLDPDPAVNDDPPSRFGFLNL